MESSDLKRLDDATRSKIRSTQILTSLPQIISELVQNSLDARAKNVELGMNCSEWECWVRDDGTGITKDGLGLIARGIKGGRYSSSKSYSPASLDELNTFGFRGEALASAADLSCLEISSRTSKSKESWSIILKGGEQLYYGPSLRWRREKAGTTVSIQDAFFNLPIRRLSHPNSARTIDLIRRELETFALVFPDVSFSFKDTSKENNAGLDRSRVLTIPRTSSTLSTFRHLFGRALVEQIDSIDAQSGPLRIEGFLSLVGSPSKAYQFLYLNRHILETCDLHRMIDKCFSTSTFTKHALDKSEDPRPYSRRSPRKGENRPVYVLNLVVPPREIDNCLEPGKLAVHFKNREAVVSFLADTIQSFLARHGFKAVRSSSLSHDDSSLRKGRNIEEDICSDSDYNPAHSISTLPRIRHEKISRKDIFIQGPSLENGQEEVIWVDPISGKTYLIDPRTGHSYQRHEDLDNSALRPPRTRRIIVDTRWLQDRQVASQNETTGERVMPDWISRALQSNDAFASTERVIPCFPCSRPTDEVGGNHWLPCTKQPNESNSVLMQSSGGLGVVPLSSLSKENLGGVQVLGQVDSKFIACLLNTTGRGNTSDQPREEQTISQTIILVDQHAADERIRVERFLKSLCLGYLDREGAGVERRVLDPPVPVLLTKFERDRLLDSVLMKKAFRDWGFDLASEQPARGDHNGQENDEGFGMIQFCSVPEIIADKLLSGSGADFRELVKSYLVRLEAESINGSTKEDSPQTDTFGEDVDEFTWLSALRHCPRELIELVNSRACRGAIMFNDQLSVEQCKRLLRRLSKTAYPFQCAHGRPSVVPLVAVDSCRRSYESLRDIDWHSLG